MRGLTRWEAGCHDYGFAGPVVIPSLCWVKPEHVLDGRVRLSPGASMSIEYVGFPSQAGEAGGKKVS